MTAGFFIGVAVWSVIYIALTRTAKWYEDVSVGAIIGSFAVIAGNGAGIGYWWAA